MQWNYVKVLVCTQIINVGLIHSCTKLLCLIYFKWTTLFLKLRLALVYNIFLFLKKDEIQANMQNLEWVMEAIEFRTLMLECKRPVTPNSSIRVFILPFHNINQHHRQHITSHKYHVMIVLYVVGMVWCVVMVYCIVWCYILLNQVVLYLIVKQPIIMYNNFNKSSFCLVSQ